MSCKVYIFFSRNVKVLSFYNELSYVYSWFYCPSLYIFKVYNRMKGTT